MISDSNLPVYMSGSVIARVVLTACFKRIWSKDQSQSFPIGNINSHPSEKVNHTDSLLPC